MADEGDRLMAGLFQRVTATYIHAIDGSLILDEPGKPLRIKRRGSDVWRDMTVGEAARYMCARMAE